MATDNKTSPTWSDTKQAVKEDLKKVAASIDTLGQHVGEQIEQRADAFGQAARKTYEKVGTWTEDLEAKLKKDWEKTQQASHHAWEKVRDRVKNGWEKVKP